MAARRASSRSRRRITQSEDSLREMRDMMVDQLIADAPRAPVSTKSDSKSALKREPQSSGCCGRATSVTLCAATAVLVVSSIGIFRVLHVDKASAAHNGIVSAEHVFWHAWLTAVSTALGVIPFVVAACLRRRTLTSAGRRSATAAPAGTAAAAGTGRAGSDSNSEGDRARREQDLCSARLADAQLQQRWHGLANAVAAGMMIAASCCLLWEGSLSPGGATSLPEVVAAAAAVVASGPEALGHAAVVGGGAKPVQSLHEALASEGGAAAGLAEGTGGGALLPIRAVLQQTLHWFGTTAQPVTTAAAALSPHAAGQTLAGMLGGALFVWASGRYLHANEDLSLLHYLASSPTSTHAAEEEKKGSRSRVAALAQAKRMLLMVAVMFLHSAAEGIGLGVSFGSSRAEAQGSGGGNTGHGHAFGSLISLTLAVHNVPEGLATALVLLAGTSTGASTTSSSGSGAGGGGGSSMTLLAAALWAIFTSLPQPLLAVPAFLAVQYARALLPVGLGFAAGAMATVAGTDLLPEALQQGQSKNAVLATTTCAALGMFALQAVLKD